MVMKSWTTFCKPDLLEVIQHCRKPASRRTHGYVDGLQDYRGKRQHVVGYSWTRPNAHYASGLVYDCILGWGETREAAIERAQRKNLNDGV